MKDVQKREIPRFRSDPPGQSVMAALEAIIKVVQYYYLVKRFIIMKLCCLDRGTNWVVVIYP